MNVSRYDGMMFVYNFAVVVTGVSVGQGFAGTFDGVELVFGALVAAVWTVYFRLSLLPRFRDHPSFGPEEGQEPGRSE